MPINKAGPATPRKRGAPRQSTAPGPPPQAGQPSVMSQVAQRRKENADDFSKLIAAALVFTKQYADAGALAVHGPGFTTALARQAEDNEIIARFLDYLSLVGPYSELIAAGLPLLLQILANHDRVPVEAVAQFGVMPPRALEVQVRLEIQQIQQEALEKMAEAERRLTELQAQGGTVTPMEWFTPPGKHVHMGGQDAKAG